MFMLLPGAYLVTALYQGEFGQSFFTSILLPAVIIGIGGWTGTILCSPTLLGTTRGLLFQQSAKSSRFQRGNSVGERERTSRLHEHHPHHEHHSHLDATGTAQPGPHRRTGSRPRHRHHESNMSVFDFEHPTSTMLFF